MSRDEAYRVVQRDARAAWEQGRALRAVLEEDPEVQLDQAVLDDAFSLKRALAHVYRFLEALQEVEG
jgi:adenylosuccinate lyase